MTTGDVGQSSARPLDGDRAARDAAYSSMWRAVSDLSALWSQVPLVQHFAAELPRNAPQRSTGVPGRLQGIEAGGGPISEHPLRLTRSIRLMLAVPNPFLDVQPSAAQWNAWFDTAMRVESAHRLTVAWLRSRVPGYPDLPAPQLAPGTPLTAEDYTHQLIWTHQEKTLGLQLQEPPIQIGHILQATQEQERTLIEGTRRLIVAIERTEEWERFASAAAALTDPARVELGQACSTLTERLSKERVDEYSPLLLARFNYRVAVLGEVLRTLTGPAEEYAEAFGALNQLIEIAASDVFGQLAAYGPPATVGRPYDVDLRPGSFQLVSFTNSSADTNSPGPLELGQILWLGDELIPDAVRLIGSTSTFSQFSMEERWTGIILAGSSAAWS
jgi:hypothetical protein